MSNARFSVLQATAVRDTRISDSQFRTLAALGMYADENGWCFPSLSTLGEDLGKSKQAVGRDTIALKKLGYLEVRHRYDKHTKGRRSNLYRLRFDLPFSQPVVDGVSTSEVDGVSTSEVDVNVPPNVPFNRTERKKVEKRGDAVDLMLDMMKSQGMKKELLKDEIMSAFETRLLFSISSGRDTEAFIDFMVSEEKKGKHFSKFIDWWLANGGPRQYWTIAKMRQNWPAAFSTPAPLAPPPAAEPEEPKKPAISHSEWMKSRHTGASA